MLRVAKERVQGVHALEVEPDVVLVGHADAAMHLNRAAADLRSAIEETPQQTEYWETLVRARAIENLAYVIAAAQGGFHVASRETYGHSVIVDPWGNILNQLKSGTGVVIADIDRDRLNSIRRSFPAIEHRRLSCQSNAG